jgi:hypothetical protein
MPSTSYPFKTGRQAKLADQIRSMMPCSYDLIWYGIPWIKANTTQTLFTYGDSALDSPNICNIITNNIIYCCQLIRAYKKIKEPQEDLLILLHTNYHIIYRKLYIPLSQYDDIYSSCRYLLLLQIVHFYYYLPLIFIHVTGTFLLSILPFLFLSNLPHVRLHTGWTTWTGRRSGGPHSRNWTWRLPRRWRSWSPAVGFARRRTALAAPASSVFPSAMGRTKTNHPRLAEEHEKVWFCSKKGPFLPSGQRRLYFAACFP